MSLLVRKIALSKWNIEEQPKPTNADALTVCMKTKGNTLSLWKIDKPENVTEAILAIASGLEHLAHIDVVMLDETSILDDKLNLVQSEGNTPCADLRNSHYDLTDLDANSLELVAQQIAAKIRSQSKIRLTLAKVKALLKTAIEQERIKVEDLHEGLSKHFIQTPSAEPSTCPTCGKSA